MKNDKWSRRSLLAGMAAGATLLPLVPLLEGDAQSADHRVPQAAHRLVRTEWNAAIRLLSHDDGYRLRDDAHLGAAHSVQRPAPGSQRHSPQRLRRRCQDRPHLLHGAAPHRLHGSHRRVRRSGHEVRVGRRALGRSGDRSLACREDEVPDRSNFTMSARSTS